MTFLGMPTAPPGVGQLRQEAPFPVAAARALDDSQLRRNLGHADPGHRDRRGLAPVSKKILEVEAGEVSGARSAAGETFGVLRGLPAGRRT